MGNKEFRKKSPSEASHSEKEINMIYAIIKSGGKQIKATVGESIIVEKIETEGTYEFTEVLAIYDGKKLHVGKPFLKSAVVKGEMLKQGKGKKIKILRTKQKSNWARHQGHRQPYTRFFISELVLDGKSIDKAAPKKAAETKKASSNEEGK